jgi:hypothetical protein
MRSRTPMPVTWPVELARTSTLAKLGLDDGVGGILYSKRVRFPVSLRGMWSHRCGIDDFDSC